VNILEENIELSIFAMHIEPAVTANHLFNAPRNELTIVAKSPTQSSPITEHLAYLLAQANREINRQLETRLRTEGVPVEQWRVLTILSDGKGHSMGDLADAVLLNHPTLTKMIDRMVSDSLVYRVPDPDDRRKVVMLLSDRGKALSRRLNSLARSQEAHIVESYGDRATTELKRLLGNLIENST
jgi:DNA-binding MarR family transcriptional regulator